MKLVTDIPSIIENETFKLVNRSSKVDKQIEGVEVHGSAELLI